MKRQWETFQELTSDASTFLKEKLSRSNVTIDRYRFYWRKIEKYMKAKQFTCFDISVGEGFLRDKFGGRDYPELSRHEKDQIKCLNVLCEFYRTGAISFLSKEETTFEGPIGQLMMGYLSHLASLRLKATTTFEYERHLSRFLCYLNKNKVAAIQLITQAHILNFIKGIDPRYPSLTHTALQTIRCFFKYLKEKNVLEVDLYSMIPRDNYKNQKKLPSCYSLKEIELMIAAIDRGNPNGKRNYAIVMLASRLGMRASDIAGLQFENLFWEESKIVFNQYKTGNEIELPLLPDVGNAIIDYLKYGRPKSNDTCVFLCTKSPYTRIYSCSITGIVHKALVRAGISIENRKHGPHALRHSLAGILLEKGTIVPVISEVLGHKNTESTNYYLRIDLKSMRKCCLEVPLVSPSFYDQKGGYFYEQEIFRGLRTLY